MTERVLITGADGYVGRHAARAYLTETDAEVVLMARAQSSDEVRVKRSALESALVGCDLRRVSYVHTDLTDTAPFEEVASRDITHIVHAAAVTRFNVERELAERVNIAGTRKVMEFAQRCQKLNALGVLSTVYSCGLLSGAVREVPHEAGGGFANHYEWSKCEAERVALQAGRDLPLRIIRIATLFADGNDGVVTQYNALHNTLKLYFYGLLSLMPGKLDTPVYLVTGDFVNRSVFRLMQSRGANGIYHVAHESQHNPQLGELISLVFDIFESHDEFRRKRFLRPVVADSESFELLADTMDTFASVVTRQALQSMTPFGRQLYVHKELDNSRMRAELGDYLPPDYRAQLRSTVEYLVETKWNRYEAKARGKAAPERKATL